jgi:O-antigen/teichoic acid export membrane protein
MRRIVKPATGQRGPIDRVSAKSHKHLRALFGSNALVNFVYLATFLAMGWLLDAVEFGAFRVAQAYLSIAVSLAMLGLNTALTHQFPLFTPRQRVSAWTWTRRALLMTSLCTGISVYALAPSVARDGNPVQDVLYLLSFPAAVAGASLCNVRLSIYQAQGDLTGYARLQAQWKSIVFLFGLMGGLLLQAQTALIAMAMAYVAVYVLQRRRAPVPAHTTEIEKSTAPEVLAPLFRSGFWPFASICVSAIYSNVEFLYVDTGDLSSGTAGAYSLASLIFIGGTAFFMPFQTYAGSLVVNRKIALIGLLKLQLVCLVAVCLTAMVGLGAAYGLTYVYPTKFNANFFEFATLVCVKLGLWGSYAVVGSVLNFLEKGMEAFLLTVVCLVGLGLGWLLVGGINSLREMVMLQIASNVILLVGSMYLVVDGYRSQSMQRVEVNKRRDEE